MPAGDGFVGISLVLPHRSALESEDPLALGPAQVINRCVRGILEGCRLFGVDANYPGLDFVTVRGKVVGMVTFTVDDAGALLFEAVIANDREFSLLPFWLDTVDPDGCVKTELLAEDRTTCLRREIGSPLDPAEVGELVRRGYTARFGLNFEPVPFPLPPQGDAVTAAENEFSSPDWLKRRRLPGRPYRHAIRTGHLGLFEAYVRLAEDGRSLEDVTFAGDVIVNASGIERLESALRGCPAERHAIDATVRRVLDGQENFVLGIGPPSSVTDILCQSLD